MTKFEQLAGALEAAGLRVGHNIPLAPHTTFHIGGPARLYAEPATVRQLADTLTLAKQAGVRVYLLGRGSNTLFADAGFDGLVLCYGAQDVAPDPAGPNRLVAQAGANLASVCKKAQQCGLSGLEFAYGIPGSVGGAVYMNAGAYGGEMKNAVCSVDYLDETGAVYTAQGEALEFGYRTSRFERRGGVILRACFDLTPAEPASIGAQMEDILNRRKEKQPLDKPSAGSTFKRPVGAYAAALIDQCGLKGYRVGGAAISEKHAGFVVNLGGATCADVLAVAEYAAAVVHQQTGFILEREIRVVE